MSSSAWWLRMSSFGVKYVWSLISPITTRVILGRVLTMPEGHSSPIWRKECPLHMICLEIRTDTVYKKCSMPCPHTVSVWALKYLLISNKNPFSTECRVICDLPSLTSTHLIWRLPTSFYTVLQPPSFYFRKNKANSFSPQDLCTCCFLCLNALLSSSRVSVSLIPSQHPGLRLNVTFLWPLSLKFPTPILSHTWLHF